MHPVHDVDALLLLALALSSKRRPAELVDIVAAADLIQGAIPSEQKLSEAFARLAEHGLVSETNERFALSAAAQKIVTGLPKKADAAERIFITKENLYAYQASGEHAPLVVSEARIAAAITAHQASKNAGGKNMFVPKPKPPEDERRRPAPWRRFAEMRRRKS